MEWFWDVKDFQLAILMLYCMNAAWWAWHGKWADAYWMSAFCDHSNGDMGIQPLTPNARWRARRGFMRQVAWNEMLGVSGR